MSLSLTHSIRDRTAEFRSCVASIRSRTSAGGGGGGGGSGSTRLGGIESADRYGPALGRKTLADSRRLLQQQDVVGGGRQVQTEDAPASHTARIKSDFSKRAAAIGREIQTTGVKLQKLAQLAKRKTLFDDRPVEIAELTHSIKQDINRLHANLKDLSLISKQASLAKGGAGRKGKGKEVEDHNNAICVLLQKRLMSTSLSFNDVLELRTQNVKAGKTREEQFMFASNGALTSGQQAGVANGNGIGALAPLGSSSLIERSDSPLYSTVRAKQLPSHQANGYAVSSELAEAGKGSTGDFLALNMETGQQEMALVQEQDNYIQSRSSAIESIESTLSELGSIFQQLAEMVTQQQEQVNRIDANTTDIVTNVGGAQRELLKYYASMSNNRWLMLKIFGVMIIFFLVFVLVT